MSVDQEDVRRRVRHPVGDVSMTRQADAKDADIRNIVTRWQETGVVVGSRSEARYGDFSSGVTYHEAFNRIRDAEADFMDLPARVRKVAQNDPGTFLDMVQDEEGQKTLLEAGLDQVELDQVADLVAPAGDRALRESHQDGPQEPEDGSSEEKAAGKETKSQ